jgi:polyisoprenoid-binding protein YceI
MLVGLSRFARSRVAALAAAVVALSLIGGVAAQDSSTPTPGVLATPAAEIDCATAPAPAAVYAIVSDKSEVRYKAEEELAGKGANTAIGKTNAFIGSINVDANGAPLACSRFDADLRTLKSDESRRDNFLYNNTLETGTYPLATFIVTEVQGLNGPLTQDDTTFTLIGNLTLHGVTKLVAWTATAKLDGDTITGSATTTFEMPDFDITPPKVGPVLSLDETVTLEVDLTATKNA